MKCSDKGVQLKSMDNNFAESLSISPFYPFAENGCLCPYLDDAGQLFQILQQSTHRQTFKKFCKAKEWPGKPNIPKVMTDEALKLLFLAACNSADARRAMAEFEGCISLHRVIYGSISAQNHTLHDACLEKIDKIKGNARKNCITPVMFREVIAEHAADDQHHEALHLLALSLAMLKQKQAADYIGELLRYFPDSAASMGCLDEVDGSLGNATESASYEDEIIDHSSHPDAGGFSCTLARASELAGQCRAVKSRFDEHRRASGQIAAASDLEAFSGEGLVETLVRTLTRTRKMIAKSGGEISEILEVECQRPDGLKCAFAQEQGEFCRCRPEQVGQLIVVAGRAVEVATSVEHQGKLARTKLPSLKSQAIKYLRQLGRTDNDDFGNTSVQFPCEASRAMSSMQEYVDQLKDEFDTRLTKERAELQNRLDALEQTESHLTASGASQFNEQIIAICRSLHVAEDMPAINDCRSQIHSLEEVLRDASLTLNLSSSIIDAASRVQSSRESTVAVLDLCEALLELNFHDIALLVLLTRQQTYSAEEIIEEPDRAIGILVEVVCRIGDARCVFPEIWHKICVSPWLLAIRRNDLTSTDLIACLAVMYVAEAISGSLENSVIGLLNLGMSDRGDLSLPPSVVAMVEAIVSHRSFRVVTVFAGSGVDKKRKEIEECIAFDNGKYRHIQCSKATHFARFEAVKVFPELERFWKKVSAAVAGRRLDEASKIARSVDHEWIEQMEKSHDRDMQSHPHFSSRIRSFVASFVELVRDYIDECGGLTQGVDIVVDEQPLRQELAKWAGNNTARQSVAKCFTQQTLGGKIKSGRDDLFEILLSSREVISSCPSAVAWSLSQRLIQPTLDLETQIIEDLGRTRSQEEIDDLLSTRLGWVPLKILWQENDPDRELGYAKKETIERRELQGCKPKIIEYSEGSLVEVFDACCNAGRFEAARGILNECEMHLAKESTVRMGVAASQVTQALKELERLKDSAEDKGMPSEWVSSIYAQASGIERPLKQLQRAITKGDQIDYSRLSHLEDSMRALMVVVRERSNSFDAVMFHLEGKNLASIASRGLAVTEQDAHSRCPDLVDAWATLRSCGEDKVHAAWVAFAKLFGKLCNLYHDENDPNGRFVPVTPFDYPHSIYQTAFYKPKSEFLKRPLRFYLYRTEVDNQARQRLDSELSQEQSAAWLHVVFAPSGTDKLRKAFQLDKKFRCVLVIDDAFLYRICVEDKHDVPVRRGLHGVVADLISSSPFVANGYCHQENNIYVGRTEVIQRLLNHPQAMIWGGRRIGKTSVLHALESTLARRHYKVALVYADVHDSVDPDLAIAQRLTDALGLSSVNSVSEFVRQIQTNQKNGVKYAFLFDEVDEYIKKSRQAHSGEFPLASGLRQVVMEDSAKNTVLVYSGYHQLYFEAKLGKSKKRVGHPFVNIASDFPIRDLSHNEVIELVKTGFEEMLGIDLHPDVPSLVAEKASCHPAFVQEFCRCLLGHVSRRRPYPQSKIIISAKDVEDVYKADGYGDGGEQPFIFYVDETLGYNLSNLGRAVMLTIATEEYYSKEKIFDNLCEYAEAAEVEHPRDDHFNDTIDLLVMTNLLTQDSNRNDYYRMTYPTFIEILGRLNKLEKTEIEKSLKSYDKNERHTGILR
ncbi:MAG: hypothetical protein ACOH2B_05355 [Burkholderiaceae bacterium]